MENSRNKEIEQLIDEKCQKFKDFPKPGIVFRDVSELFLDHTVYNPILDEMVRRTQIMIQNGQGKIIIFLFSIRDF